MGRNSKDNSLTRFEKMVRISVRYNDYLAHPGARIVLSSASKKRKNDAAKFVSSVKEALSHLTNGDRLIIQKEFFDNDDLLWWEKFYSKSTYYRRRNFAIKNFMEHFEQ